MTLLLLGRLEGLLLRIGHSNSHWLLRLDRLDVAVGGYDVAGGSSSGDGVVVAVGVGLAEGCCSSGVLTAPTGSLAVLRQGRSTGIIDGLFLPSVDRHNEVVPECGIIDRSILGSCCRLSLCSVLGMAENELGVAIGPGVALRVLNQPNDELIIVKRGAGEWDCVSPDHGRCYLGWVRSGRCINGINGLRFLLILLLCSLIL